jgi:hypothetical protein
MAPDGRKNWHGVHTHLSAAKGRALFSANILGDGRILVAGGIGTTQNEQAAFDCSGSEHARFYVQDLLDTAQIFDPLSEKWESAPPMPFPQATSCSCVLQDGCVALFGGFVARDGLVVPASTCVKFDPISHAWQPMPSMPVYNLDMCAVSICGGAIVCGGAQPYFNQHHINGDEAISAAGFLFDNDSQRWYTLPHLLQQGRMKFWMTSVSSANGRRELESKIRELEEITRLPVPPYTHCMAEFCLTTEPNGLPGEEWIFKERARRAGYGWAAHTPEEERQALEQNIERIRAACFERRFGRLGYRRDSLRVSVATAAEIAAFFHGPAERCTITTGTGLGEARLFAAALLKPAAKKRDQSHPGMLT